MASDISQDTLNKETDALFWAQTGYKVGQKLDPRDTADQAYRHVWMDTYNKVKRAAEAGTLVTTFDHPAVEQHLSDSTPQWRRVIPLRHTQTFSLRRPRRRSPRRRPVRQLRSSPQRSRRISC
jgi:hypothetical protein